jgi:hypothetical protein
MIYPVPADFLHHGCKLLFSLIKYKLKDRY